MSAKIITFGIQKGGVGKSTASGISAFLLAKRGYKVLAIDMDSQGNLSQLLSGEDDVAVFTGRTILEGIREGDASPYVLELSEHLHLIPADDYLSTVDQFLFREYKYNPTLALDKAIEKVKDQYDFIIIDTPPALSSQTINALSTSTHVVIMFETNKFAFSAVERFIRTIEEAKNVVNPKLEIAGILRTLTDARINYSVAYSDVIDETYPELTFDTIIQRRASIGKLPVYGLWDTKDKEAFKFHEPFIEELLYRIKEKKIEVVKNDNS